MIEDMHNPGDADNGGGNVARDPDAIQREIEQTRAELAQTIDEIADRISPRRAAARGADKVRSVFSREEEAGGLVGGAGWNGHGAAAPGPAAGAVAAHGGAAYTGTTTFTTQRVLRKERVLLAFGVVAATAAVVVLVRSRHRD